jgi:hypothetical protein
MNRSVGLGLRVRAGLARPHERLNLDGERSLISAHGERESFIDG